jgi:hypothetical protein
MLPCGCCLDLKDYDQVHTHVFSCTLSDVAWTWNDQYPPTINLTEQQIANLEYQSRSMFKDVPYLEGRFDIDGVNILKRIPPYGTRDRNDVLLDYLRHFEFTGRVMVEPGQLIHFQVKGLARSKTAQILRARKMSRGRPVDNVESYYPQMIAECPVLMPENDLVTIFKVFCLSKSERKTLKERHREFLHRSCDPLSSGPKTFPSCDSSYEEAFIHMEIWRRRKWVSEACRLSELFKLDDRHEGLYIYLEEGVPAGYLSGVKQMRKLLDLGVDSETVLADERSSVVKESFPQAMLPPPFIPISQMMPQFMPIPSPSGLLPILQFSPSGSSTPLEFN